jgi:hypothetical protein
MRYRGDRDTELINKMPGVLLLAYYPFDAVLIIRALELTVTLDIYFYLQYNKSNILEFQSITD